MSFAEKMRVAFAKAAQNFFKKNTCELDNVLIRTVNILASKECIKLMTLQTTGPKPFKFVFEIEIQ